MFPDTCSFCFLEELERLKTQKDHMRALIVFDELDTNDDKR